jgi:hypothetical protein
MSWPTVGHGVLKHHLSKFIKNRRTMAGHGYHLAVIPHGLVMLDGFWMCHSPFSMSELLQMAYVVLSHKAEGAERSIVVPPSFAVIPVDKQGWVKQDEWLPGMPTRRHLRAELEKNISVEEGFVVSINEKQCLSLFTDFYGKERDGRIKIKKNVKVSLYTKTAGNFLQFYAKTFKSPWGGCVGCIPIQHARGLDIDADAAVAVEITHLKIGKATEDLEVEGFKFRTREEPDEALRRTFHPGFRPRPGPETFILDFINDRAPPEKWSGSGPAPHTLPFLERRNDISFLEWLIRDNQHFCCCLYAFAKISSLPRDTPAKRKRV